MRYEARRFRRTGVTNLTDDQLILMDPMMDGSVPEYLLLGEFFSEQFNTPWSHSIDADSLAAEIDQLVFKKLVATRYEVRRGKRRRLVFLTSLGGQLWAQERAANLMNVCECRERHFDDTKFIVFGRSKEICESLIEVNIKSKRWKQVTTRHARSRFGELRLPYWAACDEIHYFSCHRQRRTFKEEGEDFWSSEPAFQKMWESLPVERRWWTRFADVIEMLQ